MALSAVARYVAAAGAKAGILSQEYTNLVLTRCLQWPGIEDQPPYRSGLFYDNESSGIPSPSRDYSVGPQRCRSSKWKWSADGHWNSDRRNWSRLYN